MTPATPSHAGVRLHIVTGKGGTGKTTVAAALALALARQGKRVLLAEVEERQGISQTFDVPPLGHEETRIVHERGGGELYGMSVDVRESLMEYLQKFYKLGRAGSVLEKVGAVDFATTIAPGLRDVLLIGKVYEAAGRGGSSRQHDRPVYDAVVLDAPPTGRVVRFLNVNAEVADVARVGPIRTQADSITRMLRSHRTAVHVVSLLEEMPVQETVDALAELKKASLPVGAVIINQVHGQALDGGDLETVAADPDGLGAAVTADLKAVSVRTSAAMVTGLLAEGTEHADRVAHQQEQEAILTGLGRQVYRLPLLPEGTEAGGIRVLADALTEQGMI